MPYSESFRVPTWGILVMLAASALGVFLLSMELKRRYKLRWPW